MAVFEPPDAFVTRSVKPLATIACMTAVFGSSLYLVWAYGSITPYWDQWDAEAALLYKPYLERTLRLSDFFSPHAEHRILFIRLLGLLLLEINGYWDPLLQMTFNAVVRIAGIALLLRLLMRPLSGASAVLLAAFAALACAIPFGWQNTLVFQAPYYTLLLFGIASLLAFHRAAALSPRWWFGFVLAVGSFFSLSSGALTPAAVAVLHAIQVALRMRRGGREIAGVVVLAVTCAVLLAYVPQGPEYEPFRAQSIGDFLHGFKTAAGWPFGSLPAALLLNAPIIYIAMRTLIRRPPPDDAAWLYVALAGWLAGQFVALSFGRALGTDAPRYRDIFVVNVILNFASLLWIHSLGRGKAPRMVLLLALLWTAPVGSMLSWRALAKLPREIAERATTIRIATANLQAFLATGDMSVLSDKPFLHIPYPIPERLAAISGDPTIRSILHPSLTGKDPGENAPPLRFGWLRVAGLGAIQNWLLERGGAILGVGVGLLLWLALFNLGPRAATGQEHPRRRGSVP